MLSLLAAVTLAVATPSPSPLPSATPDLRTIVVTSAQRRDTPLSQTVKPAFVVDRATIERFGYDTVADAIRNVPGEQPLAYGAFGARAGYGSEGAIGNGTLVLLNGTPIAEGSDGEVDLGSLSSNGVERIEVVESGGSTVYGSGASGGVINIVTSVPREEYLEAAYGSFGDREVRVQAGDGLVGATFERHIATNDYPYGPIDGFPGGVRSNAEALQTDGSVEYGQTFGDYAIRATGRFTKLDLHVPDSLALPSPNAFDATNRNDVSLDLSRTHGNASTDLTLSGLRNDGSFGADGALYDARTQISLKETLTQPHRGAFVTGIDLSRESALDFLGSSGPPDEFARAQSQSALYAQQSVGLGSTGNAYAGLRAEHDAPAGSILAPGFGLNVPVAAGLRAGGDVGTSFVVPTLFDLYFPMYSNPNLLPERDRNLDAELAAPDVAGAPQLELFDRTADDLITFTSAFVPINAGRAHFQGATLSLAAKASHRIDLSASVTDLWNATQASDGLASRVDLEPAFSGTLQIERAMGARDGLALGAVARLNGGHLESGVPGVVGGSTTADAYAKIRANPHAFVTLRVRNLGNDRYGSYDAYPEPGRSYRVEFATR